MCSLAIANQQTSLEPGAVHLWYAWPEKITDPETLQSFRDVMSADERARCERFVFAADRHQFVVTRALVRTVLSRYAPVAPADWVFEQNPYGKPHVTPSLAARLRFNLTHTRGLAVCAVALDHDVGVDAEDVERRAAGPELIRYCLSALEQADLQALAAAERQSAFFDYWTLKEAYVKARGLGLSIPLQDFFFRLRPGRPPALGFAPGVDGDPRHWQLVQLQPGPRHRVALAIHRPTGPDLDVVVHEFVPAELAPAAP